MAVSSRLFPPSIFHAYIPTIYLMPIMPTAADTIGLFKD